VPLLRILDGGKRKEDLKKESVYLADYKGSTESGKGTKIITYVVELSSSF